MTNLLIFEDKVLTFFVETLPKLPKFFESAVNSIVHTIQQAIGLAVKVTLVEPKTLERSMGKAVRVLDKRKLV